MLQFQTYCMLDIKNFLRYHAIAKILDLIFQSKIYIDKTVNPHNNYNN